jgi:hypothetical protein
MSARTPRAGIARALSARACALKFPIEIADADARANDDERDERGAGGERRKRDDDGAQRRADVSRCDFKIARVLELAWVRDRAAA